MLASWRVVACAIWWIKNLKTAQTTEANGNAPVAVRAVISNNRYTVWMRFHIWAATPKRRTTVCIAVALLWCEYTVQGARYNFTHSHSSSQWPLEFRKTTLNLQQFVLCAIIFMHFRHIVALQRCCFVVNSKQNRTVRGRRKLGASFFFISSDISWETDQVNPLHSTLIRFDRSIDIKSEFVVYAGWSKNKIIRKKWGNLLIKWRRQAAELSTRSTGIYNIWMKKKKTLFTKIASLVVCRSKQQQPKQTTSHRAPNNL